jgi:hypothetical protein
VRLGQHPRAEPAEQRQHGDQAEDLILAHPRPVTRIGAGVKRRGPSADSGVSGSFFGAGRGLG